MFYDHYFVYISRGADGSLTAGMAANAEEDIRAINRGEKKAPGRTRPPVTLAHAEEYMNEADAARRLAELKKMTAKDKERLLVCELMTAAPEPAFGM